MIISHIALLLAAAYVAGIATAYIGRWVTEEFPANRQLARKMKEPKPSVKPRYKKY